MLKSLDNKVEEIFRDSKIASLAVALTDGNQTLYSRGFGYNDIDTRQIKTNADTEFKIASVTKIVTGLVAMRLVDDGRLRLDEAVEKYLPDLKLRNENEKRITPRHLLSHSAGFPTEYTPDGPSDESLLKQSIYEELTKVEPIYEVGCGYKYSNWGIRLLSYIMERITSEPYSKLAYDYVINPLRMTKTTFCKNEALSHPFALPHETDEEGILHSSLYIPTNSARLATGGLFSTANDLTKLARLLIRSGLSDTGERILSENRLSEMLKSHVECNTDDGSEYGLTMMLLKHNNKILYGHIGSAPPYSSSLFIDRERGIGVIMLTNTKCEGLSKVLPKALLDLYQN